MVFSFLLDLYTSILFFPLNEMEENTGAMVISLSLQSLSDLLSNTCASDQLCRALGWTQEKRWAHLQGAGREQKSSYEVAALKQSLW